MFIKLFIFVNCLCFSLSQKSNTPLEFLDQLTKDRQDGRISKSGILGGLEGIYLPNINGNISAKCRRDLQYFQDQLTNNLYNEEELLEILLDENEINKPKGGVLPPDIWALQMIDSWGKTEDGMLLGNLQFMGMMDECLDVYVDGDVLPDPDASLTGKYCFITYRFTEDSSPKQDNFLSRIAPSQSILQYLGVSKLPGHATCIPSSCSEQEFVDSINDFFNGTGIHLNSHKCISNDDVQKFDDWEIAGITVFSIIGAVLLIATLADYYCQANPHSSLNKGAGKFLLAFSVKTNAVKILRVQTITSKQIISSIHGIRTFSLLWVIWGHQFMFTVYNCQNAIDLNELSKPWYTQTIFNADKSVDSFFTISGMLVTYGILNQMERNKKFNIIYYYVHRIVRLLPPLALAVLFTGAISTLLLDGPLTGMYNNFVIENGCRKAWWIDILFISNFQQKIPMFRDDPTFGGGCIPQGWYVAVDMQMYLVMPLLIVPLYYSKKIGEALLFVATIVFTILPGALVYYYDIPGSGTLIAPKTELDQINIYAMPWCRMQAYLVGAWAGYVLFKTKDKELTLTKVQLLIGWTLAIVAAVLVLYGIYPFNNFSTDALIMPLFSTIIYQMFQRGTWAAAVSWVVLCCHWGYGGAVNGLLSYPGFQPLSRLSYTMFLTIFTLQEVFASNIKRLTFLSYYTQFETTVGITILGMIVALILSLMSESPILNIEKLILQPKPKEKKEDNNE